MMLPETGTVNEPGSKLALGVCAASGIVIGVVAGGFLGFLGPVLFMGGFRDGFTPIGPFLGGLILTFPIIFFLARGVFHKDTRRKAFCLVLIALVYYGFSALVGFVLSGSESLQKLTDGHKVLFYAHVTAWSVAGMIFEGVNQAKNGSWGRATGFLALSAVIGGLAFYLYWEVVHDNSIHKVRAQVKDKHWVMTRAYRKHQENIVKGVLEPNKTISDFAKELKSIDVSSCPTDFQEAYRDYVAAWAELGKLVQTNSGIPGIAKAYLRGGLSVLEFWFERLPEATQAITNADKNLEEVVKNRAKRWPACWFTKAEP